MNAAIYTRYSSNEQSGTSTIDSQIRACREYAERQGFAIREEHIYIDRAISGARDPESTGIYWEETSVGTANAGGM